MMFRALNKKIMVGLLLVTASPALLASEGRTTLQLEHNFKTTDRRHNDSVKLIHRMPSQWQFEVKFGASGGGGRNYDVAFDDMQGGSGGLVVQRNFKLDDVNTLTPQAEVSFGNSSVTYQGGARLSHRVNSDWSVYGRYRYEYRSRSNNDSYRSVRHNDSDIDTVYRSQSDTGRHRFDTGFSWRATSNLQLGYTLNVYLGENLNSSWNYTDNEFVPRGYAAFNGNRWDYANEFKLQYRMGQLSPYFEVHDVSVSGDSSSRQAQVKFGIKYQFD
ncbi:MAG: porin [Halomonas sp.]|uniref:oligogalacturonate-specific porin KdgM family protein n=1 Tax=Vreelandella zhanjiangensis TaxID=1121960 RepID=UPI000368E143|nr:MULTISPECIES: oligogalacturonate-specific porin KdgM family protein [Halomonas]MBP5979223.1 porin [Halomonas sp.]